MAPTMQGLCECSDLSYDLKFCNFCLSCWCPCIASGRIAKAAGFHDMSSGTGTLVYCLAGCCGCGTCYHSLGPAQTLRKKFNVNESLLKTCCCHLCCHPCALSSELGFIDRRCKETVGPKRQTMRRTGGGWTR